MRQEIGGRTRPILSGVPPKKREEERGKGRTRHCVFRKKKRANQQTLPR